MKDIHIKIDNVTASMLEEIKEHTGELIAKRYGGSRDGSYYASKITTTLAIEQMISYFYNAVANDNIDVTDETNEDLLYSRYVFMDLIDGCL